MDIVERILISELKSGSHDAFNRIYEMYSKRLFAFCVQYTKSSEDAEDIVQDVFIRLWSNKEKIHQEETLRSLLFIMSKNHLINSYRAKVNSPIYEEYLNHLDDVSVTDSSPMEYDEFVKQLYAELHTLPLTQQRVIELSRFKHLDNRQIAKVLSLQEQTIKNQLSIGLKALRKKMNKAFIYIFFLF